MGSGLWVIYARPSAALHPSSQVTEFTSLIIGSNRKVTGIECCHRINVSPSQINVLALLYSLCLGNTVAPQRDLSGSEAVGTSRPAESLCGGCPDFPSGLRPRAVAHTGVGTRRGQTMPRELEDAQDPAVRRVTPGHLSSRGWRREGCDPGPASLQHSLCSRCSGSEAAAGPGAR